MILAKKVPSFWYGEKPLITRDEAENQRTILQGFEERRPMV
jgi:hypothetical protein